jgi:hypothetical protein
MLLHYSVTGISEVINILLHIRERERVYRKLILLGHSFESGLCMCSIGVGERILVIEGLHRITFHSNFLDLYSTFPTFV